jgi:hypothetical protein
MHSRVQVRAPALCSRRPAAAGGPGGTAQRGLVLAMAMAGIPRLNGGRRQGYICFYTFLTMRRRARLDTFVQ